MTLIVDIGPELQAELSRRATANGSLVEAYAARLLSTRRALLPLTAAVAPV